MRRPSAVSLWRWLGRAVQLGLACRDGSVKAGDRYRFWLAEREAEWKKDPLYEFQQMMEANQKKCLADLDAMKTPVMRPLPGLAG